MRERESDDGCALNDGGLRSPGSRGRPRCAGGGSQVGRGAVRGVRGGAGTGGRVCGGWCTRRRRTEPVKRVYGEFVQKTGLGRDGGSGVELAVGAAVA